MLAKAQVILDPTTGACQKPLSVTATPGSPAASACASDLPDDPSPCAHARGCVFGGDVSPSASSCWISSTSWGPWHHLKSLGHGVRGSGRGPAHLPPLYSVNHTLATGSLLSSTDAQPPRQPEPSLPASPPTFLSTKDPPLPASLSAVLPCLLILPQPSRPWEPQFHPRPLLPGLLGPVPDAWESGVNVRQRRGSGRQGWWVVLRGKQVKSATGAHWLGLGPLPGSRSLPTV